MSKLLNMAGHKLTAAITANPPHVLKGFIGKEPIVTKVGYELKILDIMSRMFNFTYDLKNMDGDSGRMLPDGSWTGIIGQVANQTADFGFGGLTITRDRLRVMDFLPPHLSSPLTFITNWPKPVSTSLMEVMDIDKLIFFYFFLCVILLAAMLNVIGLYFPTRRQLPLTWTLLVVFMRQKLNHKLSNDSLVSMRTLLITWQLTSMVLSITYSGFIYKSFASPKKFNTINSLHDLAGAQKLGLIDIYINKNSARYSELKDSKRTAIKTIYTMLKSTDHDQSGVDLVRKSTKYLAYIDYDIKFKFELNKRGEMAYHIPNDIGKSTFRSGSFAFGIRKTFPHLDHFERLINDVISSGLINYWISVETIVFCGFEHQYNPDNMGQIEHDTFDNSDNHEAIFNSMTGIMTYGTVTSLLIFFAELLVFVIKCFYASRNKLARSSRSGSRLVMLRKILLNQRESAC